jgi:endonuclease/exonuclease/phosphatase family metal-dependent hydrolase
VARRSRRFRRRLIGLLLIAAAVLAFHWWGDDVRRLAGLGSGAAPAKGASLRIATWNLHNFPADDQDPERMRRALAALEADVLAVQEIHDPEALARLLPDHQILLSEGGGRGGQRLGFAIDPRTIEVVDGPIEHAQASLRGRVRPALEATLRRRDGGPDFRVVVVHLKAMADGLELRREQWRILAEIAGPRKGETDLVVLGDFNSTGPAGGTPEEELRELDAALHGTGLRRVPNEFGCSAYWDGSHRDSWKEASQLDLVFVADLRETDAAAAMARPLAHCGRHRCRPFRSSDAYPDLDFERTSDHCPLVLDLVPGADDDP